MMTTIHSNTIDAVTHDDEGEVLRQALVTGVCMGLPGVALSVKTNNRQWTGSDGYAALSSHSNSKDDGDDDTLLINAEHHQFCIGSITKVFVAICLLQLVEEGEVNLDQTAWYYLLKTTPTNSDHGLLLSRIPNLQTATLRQILSHQSGIPTWEFHPQWIKDGRGERMREGRLWNKWETFSYCNDLPPTCSPGEKFSYSNTGYTILGLVLEAVTGMEAATVIRTRILNPLHLSHTYLYGFEEEEQQRQPTSSGMGGIPNLYHFATPAFLKSAGWSSSLFSSTSTPYLADVTNATTNLSVEWTAGGLVSTVSDLILFATAIKEGQLLTTDTMRDILLHYSPPMCEDNIGQSSSGIEGRRLNDAKERYCHGVAQMNMSSKDDDDNVWYGHGGLTLGFSSTLLWSTSVRGGGDVIIACATNVGQMHSGFVEGKSPWDLFCSEVLLPAVETYAGIVQ